MKIKNLVKKVFGRGFAVRAGDANSCKVRMAEDGASGFFDNSFFINNLVRFKKKERKKEEEERSEDEEEKNKSD